MCNLFLYIIYIIYAYITDHSLLKCPLYCAGCVLLQRNWGIEKVQFKETL